MQAPAATTLSADQATESVCTAPAASTESEQAHIAAVMGTSNLPARSAPPRLRCASAATRSTAVMMP